MASILDHAVPASPPRRGAREGAEPGGACPLEAAAVLVLALVLIVLAARALLRAWGGFEGRAPPAARRAEGFPAASWPAAGELTRPWAAYTGEVPGWSGGGRAWAEAVTPHSRPPARDWSLGLP